MNKAGLHKTLVAANQEEYGLRYLGLSFLSPRRRGKALRQRQELLSQLEAHSEWSCGGTKLQLGPLSPGCRLCTAGAWSCLFVNGRCNASCSYCPAPQDRIDLPTTNTLQFRHPDDYASYLKLFGFRGMSVSGGEPLLTPGRTLAFLRAAREALGPDGHLWLYSNGILLTRQIARQLREAGLDEIRIDIGATGYRPEQLTQAVGIIPTVTVEIPVLPDREELLRGRLRELREAGVDHLNLHQLRLTPHNYRRIAERGFTFLHGEKVTVLESELAVLRLMRFAAESNLGLPINYCSFVFKHRYQRAAARLRAARMACLPWERVTDAGYLRSLALLGTPAKLATLAERLQRAGTLVEHRDWRLGEGRLLVTPDILAAGDWRGLRLAVGYEEAALRPQIKPGAAGVSVDFGPRTKAWLDRTPVAGELLLGPKRAAGFANHLQTGAPLPATLATETDRWETIPTGLQDYF